jgi:hypothetical protein
MGVYGKPQLGDHLSEFGDISLQIIHRFLLKSHGFRKIQYLAGKTTPDSFFFESLSLSRRQDLRFFGRLRQRLLGARAHRRHLLEDCRRRPHEQRPQGKNELRPTTGILQIDQRDRQPGQEKIRRPGEGS